ncbi:MULTISPECIES: hypothetical protein [Gordonia]
MMAETGLSRATVGRHLASLRSASCSPSRGAHTRSVSP